MKDRFPSEAFAEHQPFLQRSAYGLGGLAFGALLGERAWADTPAAPGRSRGVIQTPHFPCGRKRIIMAGGPSRLDSFVNNPMLAKLMGQPLAE